MTRVVASVLALLLVACEAVPEITFASDGGEEGGLADGDTSEGGDAGDDGADGNAMCPQAPPPNAMTCCGSNLPCSGDCGTTNCMRCAALCGPTMLCCAKLNNVLCQSLAGGACH